MTSIPDQDATVYSELMLKALPPRASKRQLARSRLSLGDEQFQDRAVIAVQAHSGFGKTSLLAQWRREYLARGASVAWTSAEANEDVRRFLQSLVQAVRLGCSRPGFGRLLLELPDTGRAELEGITAWLTEVAQLPQQVVLMIDEAERLPESSFAALTYLLHNVPPNLTVAVAARSRLDAAIGDLADYGEALLLKAEDLRFRLDETIAFLRFRFGADVDPDTAARLHELTEGWPLGLQIVTAAVGKGDDLRVALAAMPGSAASRTERIVGGVLANLAAGDLDFLVRISCVGLIHPDLCRALTELHDAPERLAHLVQAAPVFSVADDGEWLRLHNLVREALRARFGGLAQAERQALRMRAMRWLADRGMVHEAARQAREAGQHELALALAEQSLYDAVTQGQQESVLEWIKLVPDAELKSRPKLRLAAAWALALSERPHEADALVRELLDNPAVDPPLRYKCALIASGAAYYADEPDRVIEIFAPWEAAQPPRDPRLLQMHLNRLAMLALLRADPAQARRHIQRAAPDPSGHGYRYGVRWADFIVGLS
jgi:LuxR family maltose regulon positive regulatory protein